MSEIQSDWLGVVTLDQYPGYKIKKVLGSVFFQAAANSEYNPDSMYKHKAEALGPEANAVIAASRSIIMDKKNDRNEFRMADYSGTVVMLTPAEQSKG